MFNKDFYPTPTEVLDRLLSVSDLKRFRNVLEPSAGKGDICDYIKSKDRYYKYTHNHYYDRIELKTIEIDPILKAILKDKGYPIIFDDFLKFNSYENYDLIVMNPPFSNGSKHLLKAIEIQETNGGAIRCILNAETIKNPFSNERKKLAILLEKYNAEIEYMQNGFNTTEAERKTSVEVALIRLDIPEKETSSIILDSLQEKWYSEEQEEHLNEELATNDVIDNVVKRYEQEVELGVKLIKEVKRINKKLKDEFNVSSRLFEFNENTGGGNTINGYVKGIRRKYWEKLFNQNMFTNHMTNDYKWKYTSRINELTEYDFNKHNIQEVKSMMFDNLNKGLEESIMGIFEKCTFNHSYYPECKNNIHLFDGWKTNKAYKVGKKVILPMRIDTEYFGRKFAPLIDFEKTFNYLDDFKEIENIESVIKNSDTNKKIDTHYFKISIYKKGTVHITFKD